MTSHTIYANDESDRPNDTDELKRPINESKFENATGNRRVVKGTCQAAKS